MGMGVSLAVRIGLERAGGGAPPGPGGANDVLLLVNNTDGLLLTDGTSFLKLASSS